MSDQQPDPIPQSSGYARQIERLDFEQRCEVAVTAPVWAMTREPIGGMTENITANGLKVVIDALPVTRADQWQRAMEAFERIMVKVALTGTDNSLELPGQIVWCRSEPNEQEGTIAVEIGVLFGLLRDREKQGLQRLLTSLDTAF